MFGIRDLLTSVVGSLAMLFVGPDMESKVHKWGKDHGVQKQ